MANLIQPLATTPMMSLSRLGVKIALSATLLFVSGCKSEEEKIQDALDGLRSDLEQEFEITSRAMNDDDGEAAVASLTKAEDIMLAFDEEYLGDQYCFRDVRLKCHRNLVSANAHPVVIGFFEAYSSIERAGGIMQVEFPAALAARRNAAPATSTPRMPAADIDGSALLPPPSSGN